MVVVAGDSFYSEKNHEVQRIPTHIPFQWRELEKKEKKMEKNETQWVVERIFIVRFYTYEIRHIVPH